MHVKEMSRLINWPKLVTNYHINYPFMTMKIAMPPYSIFIEINDIVNTNIKNPSNIDNNTL
jgi:hypothetical protein